MVSGTGRDLDHGSLVAGSGPEDANAWDLVAVSTKARASVNGLASARHAWFRVAAIGTAGLSPWSDVAHTLVR